MSSPKEKIRVYPNNFEAEQAMLCCIMIDGRVAEEVIPQLKSDNFYNSRHKTIFEAMKKLHNSSISVDIVTLNDLLQKQNDAGDEMAAYLVELMNIQPSAVNYKDYVEILNRDTILRYLIDSCNTITKWRITPPTPKGGSKSRKPDIFDFKRAITKRPCAYQRTYRRTYNQTERYH